MNIEQNINRWAADNERFCVIAAVSPQKIQCSGYFRATLTQCTLTVLHFG